jgi:hypothetical protein
MICQSWTDYMEMSVGREERGEEGEANEVIAMSMRDE